MKVRVEKQIGNATLSFETGQLGKQAAGCILTQYGDTVVLTAAALHNYWLLPDRFHGQAVYQTDALLLLSMLQHDSRRWSWGRYVVVHPEANTNVAGAVNEYREALVDDTTFGAVTIETLLGAKVLAPKTGAALRRRYLP